MKKLSVIFIPAMLLVTFIFSIGVFTYASEDTDTDGEGIEIADISFPIPTLYCQDCGAITHDPDTRSVFHTHESYQVCLNDASKVDIVIVDAECIVYECIECDYVLCRSSRIIGTEIVCGH